MIQERARGRLVPEVFRDLASVEALWRSVESDPAALSTPYQRFDWVSAFVSAKLGCTPEEQDASLRVIVLRDPGGRPRVILPLQVARVATAWITRPSGSSPRVVATSLHGRPKADRRGPTRSVMSSRRW